MTTVAYQGGVMIGDTRAYGFDRIPVGTKEKVHRLTDGSLMAVSSSVLGTPARILQWVQGGRVEDQKPKLLDEEHVEVLLVSPDGEAFLMDKHLNASAIVAPYYAVGSGREFAMAAMLLGLSPARAVGVATELDPWTAFPLVGYDHEGNRHEIPDSLSMEGYK